MDPFKLLKEAVRAVPSLRYALGVAGIAAVVAIVIGQKLKPEVAVFGTLIVLGLMFVLVVFAQYAGEKDISFKAPALVLVWFYTLAVIVATTLFMTSYFLDWPPLGISKTKGSSESITNLDKKARQLPIPDQMPDIIESSPERVGFTLVDSFINRYKNRATLDADIQVNAVSSAIHPVRNDGSDGDLMFAGKSAQVVLPVVGELMNAVERPDAIGRLRLAQQSKEMVTVWGIWRLWPEHLSLGVQEQGTDQKPDDTSNPGHVFELHPVLKIAGIDVTNTVHAIPGFEPYSAAQAFSRYEKATFSISRDEKAGTVTLYIYNLGYNYTQFLIKAEASPVTLEDGTSIVAEVLGSDGDPMATHIRMIAARGTSAEIQMKSLQSGEELRVLGIPRINLDAISGARTVTNVKLPYEMIIVAASPP